MEPFRAELMDDSAARFLEAVRPLVERIGASLVDPAEIAGGDEPLAWRGALAAGVRFADSMRRRQHPAGDDTGGLAGILDDAGESSAGPWPRCSVRTGSGRSAGWRRPARSPTAGRWRRWRRRWGSAGHGLQLPESGPRLTAGGGPDVQAKLVSTNC